MELSSEQLAAERAHQQLLHDRIMLAVGNELTWLIGAVLRSMRREAALAERVGDNSPTAARVRRPAL